MNKEIKRLLKLDSIKGFQLLESEKKMLEEWKAKQKHIKPVKKNLPKGAIVEEIGTENHPSIVMPDEANNAPKEKKVVKNIVEDKETGKIGE